MPFHNLCRIVGIDSWKDTIKDVGGNKKSIPACTIINLTISNRI